MIVSLTGHRNLRNPEWVEQKIFQEIEYGVDKLITGMASGTDLLGAKVAFRCGVPFVAARPWKTHSPRRADSYDYNRALQLAESVVDVTDYESYPGPFVYEQRNQWMVDRADATLAVYEKNSPGGTKNCIQYALSKEHTVTVIDPLRMEVYRINPYNSRAWLWRQYMTNKKTPEEIAEIASVTTVTVYNWLRSHKIPTRRGR